MKKTFFTLLLATGMSLFGKDAMAQNKGGDLKVDCLGSKVTGVSYSFNHRDGADPLGADSKMGSSVLTFIPASKELKATQFFTDYAAELGVPPSAQADKVKIPVNPNETALVQEMMSAGREACAKNTGTFETFKVSVPADSKIAKTAPGVLNGMK